VFARFEAVLVRREGRPGIGVDQWLRPSGSKKTLAETVNEFTIRRREIVQEAVDGFDDDSPLRQTRDGTEGVEPRLHFHRDSHTQLRIILDLFTLPGSCRWSSRTTPRQPIFWHDPSPTYLARG
jgi:hypothetical protein